MISGAAFGIDGAAHRGALAAEGSTVAVQACGLDRSARQSQRLLDRIAGSGAVISEYPPGGWPARHRFLVRNRLIAAFAPAPWWWRLVCAAALGAPQPPLPRSAGL